jgi:hypothetical protein
MKPTKCCLKKGEERGIREYSRGDEFLQDIVYAPLEI